VSKVSHFRVPEVLADIYLFSLIYKALFHKMFKALQWDRGIYIYMLYAILKIYVFSWDCNNDRLFIYRFSSGSLFQRFGEALLKERAPYVSRRICGTDRES
jgi:hypothetical protein